MNKLVHNKDKQLKYDFLPSAIEIIDKPASPIGKSIIYIISIFILLIIVWAYIGKIDQVVTTSGQTATIDGIKTIDTNLSGKIASINKSEGDKVTEGEEILTIENLGSDSQINQLKTELNEKKLNKEIHDCIINNQNIDDDVYNKYNVTQEKVQEFKEEEKIRKQNENTNYDNYIKKIHDINAQIDQINNSEQGDKTSISDLENQKTSIKESYESSVNQNKLSIIKERNELQKSIEALQTQIESAQSSNNDYIIKSNVSGTIIKSNYNTVGSYINQNNPIAEVVPDDAELEIETTIPNKYISEISNGQEVSIKLEAYDYQKYGALTGQISYISPSSIMDNDSKPVYKVKIKFDNKQNEKINVLPGMTAIVEIKTEKVRIIDLFLKPFRTTIDSAF